MDWEHVNLLFGVGRFVQALTMVDLALPRCVEALGPQEQSCRYLFIKKAQTLLRLGRVDLAREDLPRLHAMALDMTLPFLQVEALLLEFRLRSVSPRDPEFPSLVERVRAFGLSGTEVVMKPTFKAAALLALAEHELRAGDADQAKGWTDKAARLLGDGPRQGGALRIAATGQMLNGIAVLRLGFPEQALSLLQQSHEDCAKALGPEHPTTQLYAMNTALALVELRRSAEAVTVVRRAEPMLRNALGVDAPTYQEVLSLLRRLESRPVLTSPADTIPSKPHRSQDTGALAPGFFS